MTRRTAVIVEDEPLSRVRLRELLGEADWLEISGEAPDGPSGLALIRRVRPDVAFLDIAMPGLTGIQLAAQLEPAPLIVYTTAYAEHAVAAFGVGAIDYLVKPFGRRRIRATLDRLAKALATAPPRPALTRVLLRHRGAVIPMPVDEVIRFEGRDDYVAVFASGRRYLADLRLTELESQLPEGAFIRVHRSHIVNLRAVREVRSDGTGRLLLTMTDGGVVRSSRGRAAEIRRRFR